MLNSAKAWTGGLSGALVAEYGKPIVDWLVMKGSDKLEACCSMGMPEPVQTSVSVLIMGAIIGGIVWMVPNQNPAA